MDIYSALRIVDAERLYQHVLALEGERHPLTCPQGLLRAQEYILQMLSDAGVPSRVHTFQVPGFAGEFANIEGYLGEDDAPAAVVMSHYDTYYGTTGANDNAAAVAVTLETARILAAHPNPPPVRFLFFTLEEGNPAYQSILFHTAAELGLVDEQRRWLTYQVSRQLQAFDRQARSRWRSGQSLGAVMAQILQETANDLHPNLLRYLQTQAEMYAGVTFLPGNFGHLGSWAWMDDARRSGKHFTYGICLDEIGRTFEGEGHQMLPPDFPIQMATTYRVDLERLNADWAFLVSNRGAAAAADVFLEHCRDSVNDLPYLHLHIPMDYAAIQANFPQALGSDYSAFWREDIPALALFDTAGWRTPNYGHTLEDTIEKLDFDQIARINRVVIATLLDPRLLP